MDPQHFENLDHRIASRLHLEEHIDVQLATIEDYRARITDHERLLTRLRSDLNDTTPIGRLPQSVLVEIFRQGVAMWREEREQAAEAEQGGAVAHDHWLPSVMHVCSAWRNTAEDSRELWTTFALDNVDLVRTCLQRSGQMPLVITYSADGDKAIEAECVELVKPHISRIRVIHLRENPELSNIFGAHGNDSLRMPALEELRIISRTESMSMTAAAYATPQLKSFTGIGFHLATLHLILLPTRLTHIHLQDLSSMNASELTWLLGRLPELQEIHINNSCRWNDEAWPPPGRVHDIQTLAQLQKILIVEGPGRSYPGNTYSFIMHHLRIPVVANVRLITGGITRGVDAEYVIKISLECVLQPVVRDRASPLRHLELSFAFEGETLRSPVHTRIRCATSPQAKPKLDLDFRPRRDALLALAFHLFLQFDDFSPCLSDVTSMDISSRNGTVENVVWNQLLRGVPQLTSLTLEADAAAAFIESASERSTFTGAQVPYSTLGALTLKNVKFTQCPIHPFRTDLAFRLLEAFIVLVSQRPPVGVLRIVSPRNLTEEWHTRLVSTGAFRDVEVIGWKRSARCACQGDDGEDISDHDTDN